MKPQYGWLALLASTVATASPLDWLSPYMIGNFGPVKKERTLENLQVIGDIPREVEGVYLRNGPNPLYPPRPYHWFDGDGMVHAFIFENGKVSYRNRFIETEGLVAERTAGMSLHGGLLAGPPVKNVANTSLTFHHGKLMALWEGGAPHVIDPRTLATLGKEEFGGALSASMTAHPKIDPVTGELFFFGFEPKEPYLWYYVASPEGRVTHKTAVPTQGPVFIHDFAITEHYALFFDLPADYNFKGVPDVSKNQPRIGVLPRYANGTEIRWIPTTKAFIFHFLNAFEVADGNIEVIAFRFPEMPDISKPWVTSSLHKWRIDPTAGSVREEVISKTNGDYPIIHRKYLGRANRYGFASQGVGVVFGGLVKYDLVRNREKKISFGPLFFGGESSFIPRSDQEDDGWLVNVVFNILTRKSELRIYDAKTFDSKPVARMLLPFRVPYGFHGTWVGAR